jgi:5'-deoxynucleotidase YfbR-like HD superfamily hydrolase
MYLTTLKTAGTVDLNKLAPQDIHIEDIAAALTQQARFNAQGSITYTVAQHSAAISRYLGRKGYAKSVQRHAFAHDFHEYIMGDIVTAVKVLIGVDAVKAAEERLDAVIFERFGITPTDLSRVAVKRADALACATEFHLLFNYPIEYGAPRDAEILWCSQDRGMAAFMSEYDRLFVCAEAYA